MLRRLLIVEADADGARALAAAFSPTEFLVRVEKTVPDALDCVVQWRPECMILAASLPSGSGLDLCRRVKSNRQTGRLPILMTSADRSQHIVNYGLKEGADDFMHLPCHPAELLMRVRGLLRRYDAPPPPVKSMRLGPLEIDPEQGLALLEGRELDLTRKEILVLEILLRHPKRVLTRRFLLENVWGYDTNVRTRVVDLLIFQLRRKMGRWGAGLQTRRGFGYCLKFEK